MKYIFISIGFAVVWFILAGYFLLQFIGKIFIILLKIVYFFEIKKSWFFDLARIDVVLPYFVAFFYFNPIELSNYFLLKNWKWICTVKAQDRPSYHREVRRRSIFENELEREYFKGLKQKRKKRDRERLRTKHIHRHNENSNTIVSNNVPPIVNKLRNHMNDLTIKWVYVDSVFNENASVKTHAYINNGEGGNISYCGRRIVLDGDEKSAIFDELVCEGKSENSCKRCLKMIENGK